MGRKGVRQSKASTNANASVPESTLAPTSYLAEPRTEHEARLMATSVLKQILVKANLVDPGQSRTMDYDDVWDRLRGILTEADLYTRPAEPIAALLRENFLETLVRLLVDIAPLNRLNSVWDEVFEVWSASVWCSGANDGTAPRTQHGFRLSMRSKRLLQPFHSTTAQNITGLLRNGYVIFQISPEFLWNTLGYPYQIR